MKKLIVTLSFCIGAVIAGNAQAPANAGSKPPAKKKPGIETAKPETTPAATPAPSTNTQKAPAATTTTTTTTTTTGTSSTKCEKKACCKKKASCSGGTQ